MSWVSKLDTIPIPAVPMQQNLQVYPYLWSTLGEGGVRVGDHGARVGDHDGGAWARVRVRVKMGLGAGEGRLEMARVSLRDGEGRGRVP